MKLLSHVKQRTAQPGLLMFQGEKKKKKVMFSRKEKERRS